MVGVCSIVLRLANGERFTIQSIAPLEQMEDLSERLRELINKTELPPNRGLEKQRERLREPGTKSPSKDAPPISARSYETELILPATKEEFKRYETQIREKMRIDERARLEASVFGGGPLGALRTVTTVLIWIGAIAFIAALFFASS
jgi:hypothetical protein